MRRGHRGRIDFTDLAYVFFKGDSIHAEEGREQYWKAPIHSLEAT